jgi:hypothetical protein
MRQMLRRILRREIFLALWGAGWITYGVSLLTQPPSDLRGLKLIVQVAPLCAWAWFWIPAGLITIAGAVLRRRHRVWDDIGFIAAAVPPLLWSVSYIISWFPEGNFPRGCTWLLMAGAAYAVAGGIETQEAR